MEEYRRIPWLYCTLEIMIDLSYLIHLVLRLTLVLKDTAILEKEELDSYYNLKDEKGSNKGLAVVARSKEDYLKICLKII